MRMNDRISVIRRVMWVSICCHVLAIFTDIAVWRLLHRAPFVLEFVFERSPFRYHIDEVIGLIFLASVSTILICPLVSIGAATYLSVRNQMTAVVVVEYMLCALQVMLCIVQAGLTHSSAFQS
jgi:hypothetical protein